MIPPSSSSLLPNDSSSNTAAASVVLARNAQLAQQHSSPVGSIARILPSLPNTAADDAASIKDPASSFSFQKPIVIHFDINETILIGDEAGGDSVEDCLHKMIAKSAMVQIPPEHIIAPTASSQSTTTDIQDDNDAILYENTLGLQPTHWWNGDSIHDPKSVPPLFTGWHWPEHCDAYYRCQKQHARSFCHSSRGQIYQPTLELLQQTLNKGAGDSHQHEEKPPSAKRNKQNEQEEQGEEESKSNNDIIPHNNPLLLHVIPAFWKTLQYISQQRQAQPHMGICFRTFGSDLPDLLQAMNLFAQGRHPHYPHVRDARWKMTHDQLYTLKWKKSVADGQSTETPNPSNKSNDPTEFTLELWNYDGDTLVATGDDAILQVIQQHDICGIRDDYEFWRDRGKYSWAGKPIWQQPPHDDSTYHHVLLDDNIHNLDTYSIASVRQCRTTKNSNDDTRWCTLSSPEIRQAHERHLIRVPTIEPHLDEDWFIRQIQLSHQAFCKEYTNTK